MPPHILVDSHVHLHAYADPTGLVARATSAGVGRIVAVGVDVASSRWNVDVAGRCPTVVASVGVHPIQLAESIDPTQLHELERIGADSSVGFVGEIGVDSIDGEVDLADQLEAFDALLALARRLAKPVNLHLRGHIDPALDLLKRSGLAEIGAVCHYFVGNWSEARRLLDDGLIISVGKPVTRSENTALREAVRLIPRHLLLVETDSYPLPGRSTEPADLPAVVSAVAELRGCSVDAVIASTSELFAQIVGTNLK